MKWRWRSASSVSIGQSSRLSVQSGPSLLVSDGATNYLMAAFFQEPECADWVQASEKFLFGTCREMSLLHQGLQLSLRHTKSCTLTTAV